MEFESWQKRLRTAPSEHHVVHLMRDYLASRDPRELEKLPAECVVPPTLTAASILECSQRLASYHGHGDEARSVRHLAAVFETAAIRLLQLRHHPAGKPPEA